MFAHESAFPKNYFHHSETWVYEGILIIRLKPELVIHLDLALQMKQDWSRAGEANTKKTLVDLNDMVYIDPAARNLCTSMQTLSPDNAIAIYANSKFLQLIGRAFIIIDSPVWHAEVFSDLNKAVRWLKSDLC